jgi:hypothetical protein
MPHRRPWKSGLSVLLSLMVLLVGPLSLGGANAQVQTGATLTILRGQVAIIHANGTAVQPAPSGTTVDVGDEIRTITKSGALITFYSGTEIEMGEDTILVVEQLSRQGDKIDVSLRQVLGATVNRVQSLAGTGSTYQIQAGGAVALVRGTTFAMVGPVTTSSGNVVTIACREDCSAASTFNGCAMAPFSGLGVTTSGGKVESGCESFSVDRSEGLFEAATQGVTTVEQAIQGDTNGVPAGQVSPGSRQEADARFDAQQRENQQKDQSRNQASDQSTDPVRPPQPPAPPGARPCNTTTNSGGFGVTTTTYDLGRTAGTFSFFYDAFDVPDRFEVIYQGTHLLDTGFVPSPFPRPPLVPPTIPGTATVALTYGGGSSLITVIVTGSASGTAWDYTVGCPS